MTEKEFIEKNKSSWKELEKSISLQKINTKELQSLFIKVSGDLSYARTYFPNRSVKIYLNDLLNRVLDKIKMSPKRKLNEKIMNFYAKTVPELVLRHKGAFLLSLAIFVLAVLIGVFSTLKDDQFASQILGDAYVEMTEDNINAGDPMKVYKDAHKAPMFLGITINNVRVAILTFVFGVFGGIGTVFVLLTNGIMVGSFQTYFYTQGLLEESFLTIWIHGTIEILSIIVAGAAGMIIGKGLFFPKSYDREVSLRYHAREGVLVILSILPLIIIAGFLEGYVTRYTGLPTGVKLAIILTSLAFVLYIFIYNPWTYYRSGQFVEKQIIMSSMPKSTSDRQDSIYQQSIAFITENIYKICLYAIGPILGYYAVITYFIHSYGFGISLGVLGNFPFDANILSFVISLFPISYLVLIIGLLQNGHEISYHNIISRIRQKLPYILLVSLAIGVLFVLPTSYILLLVLVLFPFHASAMLINKIGSEQTLTYQEIGFLVKKDYKFKVKSIGDYIVLLVLFLVLIFSLNGSLLVLLREYFNWHTSTFSSSGETIFSILFMVLMLVIFMCFTSHLCYLRYQHSRNIMEAYDLEEKYKAFLKSAVS